MTGKAAPQAVGGTGSDGAGKGAAGRPARPHHRAARRVQGRVVSDLDGIPPAFRRLRDSPSFIGLDDKQVLQIATAAFHAAQTLPLPSRGRAEQWSRFDDAMSELAGRGLRHMLRKLRERGALAGGEVIPDELPGAEA